MRYREADILPSAFSSARGNDARSLSNLGNGKGFNSFPGNEPRLEGFLIVDLSSYSIM